MHIKYASVVLIIVFPTSFTLDDGPNVCTKQESYLTTVRVSYNKPYQVRTYTWCLAFPPRCSKYRIAHTVAYKTEAKETTRSVKVCCKGYVETADGSRCLPLCNDPCIHGTCSSPETCECQPGWGGPTCNFSCPDGKWGKACHRDCPCKNGARCDPVSGACSCKPGWQGIDCNEPCDSGKYGYECGQLCRCENGALCDHISGACTCAPWVHRAL
ncbi:hypothetical protein MRX96_050010, partial [Rhipicephalus microplus]